jgi:oligosaccharide repeat unit polymerase
MAPPFITCIGFTFSSLCSLYNISIWQIELSEITYTIIVGGLAIIIIVYWIIQKLFLKNRRFVHDAQNTTVDPIHLQRLFQIIFLAICIVVMLFYVREVQAFGMKLGGDTWNERMSIYRHAVSYGTRYKYTMPIFIDYAYKLIIASMHFWIYVLINNILAKVQINRLLLITIIIIFISSFLVGGRMTLIQFPTSALSIYYFLTMNNRRRKGSNNKKLIAIIFRGGFCILVLFALLRGFVGRSTEDDPIYYIASYGGGSIPLLDSFLYDYTTPDPIFGRETLQSINSTLSRLLNRPELINSTHKEFRATSNGIVMGNVYTAFRSYIHDFGFLGMIICLIALSLFFSIYHNYLKFTRIKKGIFFPLLFYSLLCYPLFILFFNDHFFSQVLSVDTIVRFIYLAILKVFFVDIKITWRGSSSNMRIGMRNEKQDF